MHYERRRDPLLTTARAVLGLGVPCAEAAGDPISSMAEERERILETLRKEREERRAAELAAPPAYPYYGPEDEERRRAERNELVQRLLSEQNCLRSRRTINMPQYDECCIDLQGDKRLAASGSGIGSDMRWRSTRWILPGLRRSDSSLSLYVVLQSVG